MFEVVWLETAMEAMDEILLAVDEPTKNRLVGIIEELNRRLALAPLEEGESRGGPFRLTFPSMLSVRFSVDEAAYVVRVASVERYGRSTAVQSNRTIRFPNAAASCS